MLDFETAYKTLIQSGAADVPRIGRETVSLADCLGRVLTEPVKAKLDLPPFAKSAISLIGAPVYSPLFIQAGREQVLRSMGLISWSGSTAARLRI